MDNSTLPSIAVIVPCYNEAAAVGAVVREFSSALPEAEIYVFDNNSRDNTAEIARAAGAHVFHVSKKGKGNVVRRMFADVEADIYIMVDGDATYHAPSAPAMVEKLLRDNLDMLVGCRVDEGTRENYRRGHRFGNRMLTGSVMQIFGGGFTDMLSGYRVFSRRFAKSFPSLSSGFEIETELTVHALENAMPYGEMATPYGARPEGSESKLSTYKDGIRIARTIGRLYMFERPLACLSILAAMFALAAIGLTIPLFLTWLETGLVPRLPTAVAATGLSVFAMQLFVAGIILDSIGKSRREMRRFAYLAIPIVSRLPG
ncbi:RfbJ protein [Advenella kashmirensis W13003]|uniref:RfbJ protein n=1 Tax=Advenella kashmirensis W13003 TaxID=1424334 RepID=V8QW74_9BURK|nr:glycosyltransferase family 2 protein [Advenella kashmirensis]ETF03269.1 RfbJ protein [Advenella kashmirensis W13003]